MHQALDALLDLDEAAVVGQVRDLAEQAGVDRVAPRDRDPRIVTQLLQAERDAVALAIELEDLDRDLGAHRHDLGWMLDALPGHVGDVQQAVDAAEVDERTVVGEVLDHALDGGAFLQVAQQLGTLGAVLALDHGTARDDDVVAPTIELDDLELEFLALEVGGVAHRAHIHQRTGEESADLVDVDGEAALDLAGDHALDRLLVLERLLEAGPGTRTLGLLA